MFLQIDVIEIKLLVNEYELMILRIKLNRNVNF
jgi:hypothetical protein